MKDRLRKFIEEIGVNQNDFAKQVGIAPSYLSLILTGQRNINDNVLSAILLANPKLNSQWLLQGEGEMFAKPTSSKTNTEKEIIQFNLFEEGNEEEEKTEDNSLPKDEQKSTPIELNIPNPSPILPQKTHSQERKKIKKIVFFFEDKTFEEYYPE